ncbi:MAG: transposase, partial [Candidatus Omnitrophica bacterium]|nr:transposase [Candidatus Omnitrophota bacterium]
MKITYNVSNKTFVAEPYPRVNFVQYAKRYQNFAPLCGRTQSHSSYRGIFLVHQFCKKLRLKWRLQTYVKFHQRSSLYHPVELILAIIYALIAGIHRLNKTKILQGNGAFQRIVGLKDFPYSSSLRRFLKRVNPKTIQGINKVHDHLRLKMYYLPKPRTSFLF